MTTRTEAIELIKALNAKVATLTFDLSKITYAHEIDNGYSKIETIGATLAVLYKTVFQLARLMR